MSKLILRAKTNINAIKRKAKRRYSSTKLSFKEAFQEARRLGKEEFIYNGKKYGTKLKDEISNLGSKFLSDDSKSQPTFKSKLNQTTNLPVGDSYLPFFNTQQTYLYNYNNSPEGLMWGIGSEKNPVQLSEVVVTATRPRESYNVKANSLKRRLEEKYQGEKCAKWRNDLLNAMGFEIYGDAWTTANFADKVFSGFDGLKRPKTTDKENLEEFSAKAARNFADNFSLDYLNPKQIYVVGTTYKGSPNKKFAFENGVDGEANTHTGYAKYENGLWMFHSNAGGTEYVSPMNKMLGDTASMAITSIYKPRLKKLKNGGLISRKFKIGGYFLNGKVIKGQSGLDTTDTHLAKNPNGVDMTHMGINKTGGISYANSDSQRINNALAYGRFHLADIANQYGLTMNAFYDITPLVHAILYKESNGGYPTYMSNGQIKDNTEYRRRHLDPIKLGFRETFTKDPSQGMGSVKRSTLKGNEPYVYNGDYNTEGDEFSGISTYAAVATNYNHLKELFGDNNPMVFNEDGTLNKLGLNLILIAHNLGWDNIEKNYSKWSRSGDNDELTLYNIFNYPTIARQVIDSHSYPRLNTVLDEVTITAPKLNKRR